MPQGGAVGRAGTASFSGKGAADDGDQVNGTQWGDHSTAKQVDRGDGHERVRNPTRRAAVAKPIVPTIVAIGSRNIAIRSRNSGSRTLIAALRLHSPDVLTVQTNRPCKRVTRLRAYRRPLISWSSGGGPLTATRIMFDLLFANWIEP